ncbi:MAG: ATP-binding protein [bacterium]|nr:ATP-binding protein [bacterium]
MLRIESLRILEFRGLRDLAMDVKGKSHIVLGPNGSGKSGVVDAIEFALTGDVSRLKGPGTKELSLVKHAPHVHSNTTPSRARVEIVVSIPKAGSNQRKSAKLVRTVEDPKTVELLPHDPDIQGALDRVAEHPEIVLSRREIIKYIVAEPKNRADDVQTLLKLLHLSKLRALLLSVSNLAKNEHKSTQSHETTASEDLLRHLDISSPDKDKILVVVNDHRDVLKMAGLEAWPNDDNIAVGLEEEKSSPQFNKDTSMRDIQTVIDDVESRELLQEERLLLASKLEELDEDPHLVNLMKQHDLLTLGLEQLIDESCPLCDHVWPNFDALREHLEGKKERAEAGHQLRQEILQLGTSIGIVLERVGARLQLLLPICDALNVLEHKKSLMSWKEAMEGIIKKLDSIENLKDTRLSLETHPLVMPSNIPETLQELMSLAQGQPTQSRETVSRDFLVTAQDRLQRWKEAESKAEQANRLQQQAVAIHDMYCNVQDEELKQLYGKVQKRFGEFYGQINYEDEREFSAQFSPEKQALRLDVDFYGTGKFPPVAYHSEGHQDSMGICLYLALMEYILNDHFTLAVLDDVLMSIDSNHRREICTILAEYFGDVQFIITTHDRLWAKEIVSQGIVEHNGQTEFYGWNVDTGPIAKHEQGFWSKIEEDLSENDVHGAAGRLRRNMEAEFASIAERLESRVTYRPLLNWSLGELLDSVASRYSRLLQSAEKAAKKWNREEELQDIEAAQKRWKESRLLEMGERWAVNPAVHYNNWGNFAIEDFRPVVDAYREFLGTFLCSVCNSQIYLVKKGLQDDGFRCQCGNISFSL